MPAAAAVPLRTDDRDRRPRRHGDRAGAGISIRVCRSAGDRMDARHRQSPHQVGQSPGAPRGGTVDCGAARGEPMLPCAAGVDKLYVRTDGGVYGCHLFEQAGGCADLARCAGGCRARAWLMTGEARGRDPSACRRALFATAARG